MFPYSSLDKNPLHTNALHGFSLLDSQHQPALERATRILATALDAPVAFVSVVDRSRVSITATQGLTAGVIAPNPGLCVTTVTGSDLRVIPDTLLDLPASSHPFVCGQPGLRFYAGIPLATSGGFVLGTLAVADTRPRDLDKRQRAMIQDVAGLLVRDIEVAIHQDHEEESFRICRMLNALPVAHFTCRLDGTILTWSPAAQAMYGYEPAQIAGQHLSILAQHKSYREMTSALAAVASRESVGWFDAVRITRSGQVLDVQDSAYPIVSSDGNVLGAAWVSRDVSEQRRLEALVWEGRERFDAAATATRDAVILTDVAGNVEYLNPPAQALTGWTTEDARGHGAGEVVDFVHELSMERIKHPVQTCIADGVVIGPSRHAMIVHRDGRMFGVESVAIPIRHRDGQVTGAVVILHPLDDRQATPSSDYLGDRDALTGLPNRQELENQIERALVTSARDSAGHVLLILTVPQYTAVQVRQGTVAANELLKQISAILRTRLRESDMLARLEDDRLAALLTHCPADQAGRIAAHLQDVVGEFTFTWHGRATLVGLRTMLLPIAADVRNASALLDMPDVALDLINLKRRMIRNGEPEQAASVVQDGSSLLADAFTTGRFRLYAQEIAPLSAANQGGELYEFLVHLLDDQERVLSPSVFIEAAARDDLATDLDRWVVQEALSSLAEKEVSLASVWMINISSATLHDETFPDFLGEQFEAHRVAPWSVCFEMSETVAIANLAATMRFIGAVRAHGCRVSLSQFGTSLHTFSYLRNLDVSYIKIDGSVVRDIADDGVNRAVVGAIGHIAHVMGIQTVAEHVETSEVLECLRKLAIDYAQGYAVSKPVPLAIVS